MEAHFTIQTYRDWDPQSVLEQIRLFMSAQEAFESGDVLYGNDATDNMVLTEIKNGVPRSSTCVVANEIWSHLKDWLASVFNSYSKSNERTKWDVYVIIGESCAEGNLVQLKSSERELVYELAITHQIIPDHFRSQVR